MINRSILSVSFDLKRQSLIHIDVFYGQSYCLYKMGADCPIVCWEGLSERLAALLATIRPIYFIEEDLRQITDILLGQHTMNVEIM